MNTYGELFKLTTFGESHGPAIGGVIDGCPSGIRIDMQAIDADLARRRGVGPETTARKEPDEVEFLSGLMDGVTLGTPIAFVIRNCDAHSADYNSLEGLFRPGHAEFAWNEKYGIIDHRGGGRASARETVARVVAGAIAKQILGGHGIVISSEIDSVGELKENDTAGGIIRCICNGVPAGLGEPIFGKFNAQLAAAMMSIPSAIGFEMGLGFAAAAMTGSQFADAWNDEADNEEKPTITNHCGGIQGGISNGMPIEFRVAFHPIVTTPGELRCRDKQGNIRSVDVGGRHDRCQISRTTVIVEAMAALCLLNNLMKHT